MNDEIELMTERGGAFTLRRCGEGDLADIVALQTEVAAALERAHLFVQTPEEELADSLGSDVCLGVYDGERLAAFSVLVLNRVSPRSLGSHLGYTEEEMRRCVTYDTTFVHPDYRGCGLQRTMIEQKDLISRRLGVREALATASPENEHSLRNMRACGFYPVEERVMYTGVRRYIMKKDFAENGAREGAAYDQGHIS